MSMLLSSRKVEIYVVWKAWKPLIESCLQVMQSIPTQEEFSKVKFSKKNVIDFDIIFYFSRQSFIIIKRGITFGT